jgi:hypothetical protein
MLSKAKFAVCSEIYTKHTNSMWSQCRIFEYSTLWHVKLPVGSKMLKEREGRGKSTDNDKGKGKVVLHTTWGHLGGVDA